MALYCGLNFYTKSDIEFLIQSDLIEGIVLGDLFCQRKMFQYGESQLHEFINVVGRSSKRLVYQTPIYITSRNRMQVLDNIKYINANFPESIILTQDIGALGFIKENCDSVKVAWSRMGRTREYKFNKMFFEALGEIGVNFFETESLNIIDELANSGIQPFLVYGNTHYKTIGRRCYCQYELNINDENCSHFCRNSEYEMETVDGSYKMSIDGYMLGLELKYNSEILKKYEKNYDINVVLYVVNFTDLQTQIANL